MAADDPILCAVDGRGIAAMTLNRPAVNNAYNGALIDAVIDIFGRLAADPSVRIVVLRGTGRNFQAGADLAFLDYLRTVSAEENRAFSQRTVAAFRAVQLCPCPTMALIQGGCFGGGIGFAAACDTAIAAEDAAFGITKVRWGITPAPIIPLLVDRIGARMTGRFALAGERFDAAQARAIGLVHETCPAGDLEAAGERVVEHLLLAGPEAVAITKRLIEEAVETPLTAEFQDRIVAEATARRRTEEAAEGLASFREKRKPGWYPDRYPGRA